MKEVFIYAKKVKIIKFNCLYARQSFSCRSFDSKSGGYNCKLSITVELYHDQSIHGNSRLYKYTGNRHFGGICKL
ncbi:hypothetical protein D3C81_1564430 [compost metagenome]